MTTRSIRFVIFTMLLSVFILLNGQSSHADENDYKWYLNADSTVTISGYIGSDKDVNIPNQLNGKVVTSIGRAAFENKGITSVDIPPTVTSIGPSAFHDNLLSSVVIPDDVKIIEANAFSLNQLTSVTIPEGITSIGRMAFSNNKLISVDIPGTVISIGLMAFSRNELTSVTLQNGLESIGDSAFYINSITHINIPDSVTTIGDGAFSTNDLTGIIFPNSIASIGKGTFADNELETLAIPNGVTDIGDRAFSGNKLTSLMIPDGVTSIGDYAFYGNQLTSVIIPPSVRSIGFWAFGYNPLTNVTIWSDQTVILDDAFIFVPANLTFYGHVPSTAQTYANKSGYKFQPIIHKVTYDGNGHTGGNTPVDGKMYECSESVMVLGNTGLMEKLGHTFDGWNSTVVGSGDNYDENDIFAAHAETEEIMLYAKWAINTYPVSFESNAETAVATQSIVYNEKATEPNIPTKAGNIFVGWYKDAALTSEWKFSTDVVTEDITLYAKWAINTYTVSFDSKGGTKTTAQPVAHNEKATEPSNPKKAGHTFVGWYKDVSFTDEWDFRTDTVQADMTLYAKWRLRPTPDPTPNPEPDPELEPGTNKPYKTITKEGTFQETKVWTVTLSSEVDALTVQDAMYLVDLDGNRISATFTSDGSKIFVHPTGGTYLKGTYTLYITSDLKNKDGVALKKPIKMIFKIE